MFLTCSNLFVYAKRKRLQAGIAGHCSPRFDLLLFQVAFTVAMQKAGMQFAESFFVKNEVGYKRIVVSEDQNRLVVKRARQNGVFWFLEKGVQNAIALVCVK